MADDILEGVPPTRMEYLKLKDKLTRAEKGHRLLKEKRDNLVMEFMNIARESYEISDVASNQIERAGEKQALANALAGEGALESAALAAKRELFVDADFRNIMGIKLPTLKAPVLLREADSRGFSLLTTHPSVTTCAAEYERSLERLIELAQTASSLESLSSETKKTKRRVNALEYKVIPRLKNTRKHIRMRLDELEREGFYARKMIKKKGGS